MTAVLTRLRRHGPLLLLIALIFVPRLLHLDRFLTADEPLFMEHARQFAAAFRSGDLSQTLGIGYPGVTVAAWAAPLVDTAAVDLATYAAGRLAAALLSGLLLLLLYGLARPLLGRWPTFWGLVLLALDPYSLAYSRLLHIAAPLALLMTLAGVALLRWLAEPRPRWLLLTGLFSGLALLTKSTALLLGPMLLALMGGWAIAAGRTRNWGWQLAGGRGLLLAGLVAGLTFTALWPAMWVDPAQALSLTFGKLFVDQEAGAGNLGLFWLGRFVDDPGPAFYPVAFLLKATPWLLLGLLLSLFHLAQKRRPAELGLWLFALTYLLAMTIASKKSIRYMLPVFPTFYLLAGLALTRTGRRLWLRLPGSVAARLTRFQRPLAGLLLTGLLLFSFAYHPYYLSYYNPALLGWRWAPRTLLVGWGEGLDGAARYLAERPPARVAAWYEWLFPLLYPAGSVEPVVPPENMLTADYTVLYLNQVQRDIPGPNIIDYFRTRRRPAHTVRLNGIDYAWVYPGPVAGFGPDPAPEFALTGQFGTEAGLLGYDLWPRPISGGQPLIVTLYWRILAPPPGERFVYVRLVDAQGHIWARTDAPPVMGLWPVSRWRPEMLIEDAQALTLPPGLPPGPYRLEVGLYDPATGQPLPAAGQPLGAGGGLLLGQVPVEWRASPSDSADLPVQVQIPLSPDVRLTGYTPPPETATVGQLIPLTLAWQGTRSWWRRGLMTENYVLFEWRAAGQPQAEQLEPLPLPLDEWSRGAALRAQHDLWAPPTLPAGRYTLTVRLHDGSAPAGEPLILGQVVVTAPPRRFDLPPDALTPVGPTRLGAEAGPLAALAGYRLEQSEQQMTVHLYWRSLAVTPQPYKVFVQLLDPAHTVAAQSDSLPAAGERPTPGWLPEEIIADAHSLELPPDLSPGDYRLIAGLYDPASGQRLSLLDQAGQVIGDAIFVTEVTQP